MFRLIAVLLIVSFSGCGYTTGSLLPPKYKKISVEAFKNKIAYVENTDNRLYVPSLETTVRTSIIDRFLFDGNLKIADPQNADLILHGSLVDIAQDDLRQDSNQNIQEYRIRIVVSLAMEDAQTHTLLWREPSFTGETTYFLTGPQAESQSAAIDAALTDLATRVVDRTVENW